MDNKLILSKDGVMRLQAGNPWIFKKDLAAPSAHEPTDVLIPVVAPDGNTLGWGFLTPEVDTVARILDFGSPKPHMEDLISQRLDNALKLRTTLLDPDLLCYRLVNSEGDFLPGLVVERYENLVYVDSQMGFWKQKEGLLKARIHSLLPGLEVVFSWSPVPDHLINLRVSEYGIQFEIHLGKGQKTGHYCDQRENRRLLGTVFRGESILDLFCYSGGFSLAAGKAAKRVLAVDRSGPALELLQKNAELNGIPHIQILRSEVNDFFQSHKDERFDAVICDPPKLVKRRAEKKAGLRMYYHTNLHALSRVNPGGILMTFSCSGSVSPDELQGVIASAARKIGRKVQLIAPLSAGPDHPALLALPETAYLKGFLLRVT